MLPRAAGPTSPNCSNHGHARMMVDVPIGCAGATERKTDARSIPGLALDEAEHAGRRKPDKASPRVGMASTAAGNRSSQPKRKNSKRPASPTFTLPGQQPSGPPDSYFGKRNT